MQHLSTVPVGPLELDRYIEGIRGEMESAAALEGLHSERVRLLSESLDSLIVAYMKAESAKERHTA